MCVGLGLGLHANFFTLTDKIDRTRIPIGNQKKNYERLINLARIIIIISLYYDYDDDSLTRL